MAENDEDEFESSGLAARMGQDPGITMLDDICYACVHYNKVTQTTCTAFPVRIPTDILFGLYDHHFPYNQDGESDHGIVFAPSPAFSGGS